MLFRKTFRNALATLLGMALALATGAAHAAINLDALGTAQDPVGTVVFSSETLPSNLTVTVGGQTYYRVIATSADFRVEGKLGVPGREGRQIYIRYDFGNMVVHSTALDNAWANIPDRNADGTSDDATAFTVEVGGGARQNFVIFSTPSTGATATIDRDAVVFARAHNRLAILPGAPATIRMSVYLDLGSAINQASPLTSKSAAMAVIQPSLRTTVAPGTVTATVRSGFTALSSAGANSLGTLSIGVGGSTVMHKSIRDGAVVNTLAQVAQEANAQLTSGSVVTYSGDFSVGSFTSNTLTTADASCGRPAPLATMRNNAVLESVSVAAGAGITSFCITVGPTNSEEIPSGEYTVAVDYAPVTNAAVPPNDLGETPIGVIRRDGTRVQIPYLTTYDTYNQRVVLVNRNRNAVNYTFSFVSEDGATTTAGEAAEGSVPGNSTAVLRVRDIVSIANSTRTAATLDVVAPNGTVDVATTQVNLDDQGTDTVIYDTTGT